LWLKEKKPLFLILSFIFTILLVLTWQQFHLIYVIYGLAMLFSFKGKNVFWGIIFFAIGSLLLAQIVSSLVFHSAYSPIAMIRESYLGLVNYQSEAIQIAMKRGDWRDLSLWEAIKLFSLLGWFFWLVGFVFLLTNLRKKIDYLIIAAGNILSFAVMTFFIKSKFLVLPFFLIMAALGGKILVSRRAVWFYLQDILERIMQKIKIWHLIGVIILAGLIFFVIKGGWFLQSGNLPQPEMSFYRVATGTVKNGEYRVGLQLTNSGQKSLEEKSAFNGLHIEIENTRVEDIKAYSPFTQTNVVIKPDAQRNNLYWFEVKYALLDSTQWGRIEFTIIPDVSLKKPVTVWYRGWSPGPCPLIERIKVLSDLRKDYRSFFENSWRSENCIIRSPANNEENEPLCQINVFAAHQTLQKFHCFKKIL